MLCLFLGSPIAGAAESLSGKLVSTGSDTLGSLTSLWAEMLGARYPGVLVQVRAIGSGGAPTALIQGTADIGPMSRPMSSAESAAFVRRYGYPPTAVPIAEDALAIFVHRDNPLETISISELDAVFSATRLCGYPQSIREWGELGLLRPWAARPVSVYGRSAASGTYSVFRQQVLCSGDFSRTLNRLVGSSAIVRAVATDPGGIGYASAGYLNASVKRLRVLRDNGEEEAPLARRLFLYINRPPGAELDPLMRAFLNTVLSVAGQRQVAKSGYLPLSDGELSRQRLRLGLARG
jgi:phosphate transport system substrate-binding protein